METIVQWLKKQEPFTCFYTGERLHRDDIQGDHMVPLVRGGALSLANMALCSGRINRIKGRMTDEEFMSLLTLLESWEDGGENLLTRLATSSIIYKGKRR